MRIRTASALLVGMLALAGTACGGDSDAAEGSQPDPTGSAAPGPETDPEQDAREVDGDGERAPAAFNNDNASGTFDCDGQNVTVNGEDADLHLVGTCGIVVINGEHARVTVDDAEIIVVNGAEAQLRYSGDPEITVNGENATAEPVE
jgi:hypothetical protein